jgi:hypothetical protein
VRAGEFGGQKATFYLYNSQNAGGETPICSAYEFFRRPTSSHNQGCRILPRWRDTWVRAAGKPANKPAIAAYVRKVAVLNAVTLNSVPAKIPLPTLVDPTPIGQKASGYDVSKRMSSKSPTTRRKLASRQ